MELVLGLHGQFRRSLEPIGVTSLQAGVLLFLCRHLALQQAQESLRRTYDELEFRVQIQQPPEIARGGIQMGFFVNGSVA